MNKIFTKVAIASLFVFCGLVPEAFGQTTISGKVLDAGTEEPLAGVNIIVKGKVIGTITDFNGEYNLSVNDAPPFTLVFSFIGYSTQEIEITNASTTGLNVTLEEQSLLGQEIVVSASRVEESILQSPVSIEKMDILAVQNTSADNYYKGIANLKGVDVATSSINFQIINTRGFGSTGNTRFVQLTDGMDTQAPALNFPIGNLNGPSELDVESVELIPGASSALYGPNAFNGILLVNSKSAFDYQGASAFAKIGVNHVGSDADQDMAPMYEASIRYAKAFNNKFAFKVNFSYMQADDWHGTSQLDRNAALNPFASIGGDNPGAERLHVMGDEATLNMNILRFSTTSANSVGWQSVAQQRVFQPGSSAWSFAQNGFLPNHVISAPGYQEENIVDYNAKNMKANVGLYYRLNDNVELSYLYNGGFGTSIYTGAQRYSLKNFGIQQHRLQLRGDNFYLRAYTTRENSGDSYIAEFLGKKINDSRFGGDVANYLTGYPLFYLQSLYDQGYRDTDDPNSVTLQDSYTAHQFAKNAMLTNNPLEEGSATFEQLQESQQNGVVPAGPKFNDATNLYHVEGQYDFKNQIEAFDLQVGGNYRMFDLRSDGTIFPDQDGGIQIKEYGAYAQASKRILNESLKLTGSMRYDKNENFDGQVNPRISGVYTVAQNHNFRASYQTGFRIPTTQGQFIDLDIISARLLGGLEDNYSKYQLTTNAYTIESVRAFTDIIFSGGAIGTAIGQLVPFTDAKPVKPEQIKTVEFGYKSLIANKLLVDLAYYHNTYNDFITQIQLRKASADVFANPAAAASLLNGSALTLRNDGTFTGNTAQIYTNYDQEVTSQGAVIGLTYSLPKGYNLGGNYNWNKLNTEITQGFSEFNTPEHKFNLSLSNRKITDKLGFNITYRWQEEFFWESSFATGDVPSFSTVDAQVSYKLKSLKSMLKLGGSNILNKQYIQSLGGPNIGAIYYLSITFDQLMN
ncbi:TonB-dependent receptor [Fulvivirga sp.]|uniref:TonB-dependent receptor n=1 Tax=Fulvivirga sp. TaxID=1931237 RepID=UPI0032ED2087